MFKKIKAAWLFVKARFLPFEEALKLYAKAVEFAPDEKRYRQAYDACCLKCEQKRQTLLEQAKQFYWQGCGHYVKKDYAQAIKCFGKATQLDNKNALYWNDLGDSQYNYKQYKDAIESYSRAIELDPKNDKYWYNRGRANYSESRYRVAWDDYHQAISLNASVSSYYNGRANASYSLGNYQDAVDDYSIAIEKNPKDAVLRSNRAGAWYRLGKYKKAYDDYKQAAALDPSNPQYAENMRKAERNFYKDPVYQFQQGEGCLERGNYGGAIPYFREAIRLDNQYAEAFHKLGLCYMHTGDDKALGNLSKAIVKDRNRADYRCSRAQLYMRLGNVAQAIVDFEEAVALEPKNWTYQNYLEDARLRLAADQVGENAIEDDLAPAYQGFYGTQEEEWSGEERSKHTPGDSIRVGALGSCTIISVRSNPLEYVVSAPNGETYVFSPYRGGPRKI